MYHITKHKFTGQFNQRKQSACVGLKFFTSAKGDIKKYVIRGLLND